MDDPYREVRQRLEACHSRIGPIPVNYTICDVETSGFSFNQDFILEVGYAVVRNCQIAHIGGCLLNWASHPHVNLRALSDRLESTRRFMAQKGDVFPFTMGLLATGDEPIAVLTEYSAMLAEAIDRGELIVGHNSWQFDRNMLDYSCHRFLGNGRKVPWRANSIFDTGLLEKSATLGFRGEMWDGDNLTSHYKRLTKIVASGKWSLSGCITKYGIDRHVHVPHEQAHRAYYGCLSVFYLFETWRRLLYG